MKKALRVFFLFLLFLYVLCFLYDFMVGGNDGIIGRIYFHRLLLRVLAFVLFLTLSVHFSSKLKGVLGSLFFQANIIVGFLIFLEVCSFLFLRLKGLDEYYPNHLIFYNNVPLGVSLEDRREKYYGDIDAEIGRWRIPNTTIAKERCSDKKQITYSSNEIGARDVSRQAGNTNRVVALGDSFIEGTLVNAEDRLTNILESKTGVEHLNFGTIQANPLVEYFTLKSKINPNYSYDKLMLGILPANDFESNTPSAGARYTYPIYRPYIDPNSKRIKYSLASYKHSIESIEALKNSTIIRNTRDSLYRSSSFLDKLKIEFETNSYIWAFVKYSFVHGSKSDLERYPLNFEKPPLKAKESREFELSLLKLLKEQKAKKVLIVIFPLQNDLEAYRKHKINLFTPYLKNLLKDHNIGYIDLLEMIGNQNVKVGDLYIACDGHFNPKGNALCAELIFQSPAYKAFMR